MENRIKITTTTVVASLIIGLIMLSPMTVLPHVVAQQNPSVDDLMKNLPTLSSTDKDKAEQIAESNPSVQKIINGRTHSLMSVAQVGNIYANPMTSYPDVHLNVADQTQIEVVVNLQTNSVLTVAEWPLLKTMPEKTTDANADPPAYAIDGIVSSSTVNGLKMTYTATSYGSSGANKYSAFLINAVEPGATFANECNSGHVADSEFAQAGALFGLTAANMGYADTGTSCVFNSVSWVPYTTSHNYDFKVYTSASPAAWNMAVTDTTNGNFFVQSRTGVNHNNFQASNTDTSGFLENWNTNSNWYNQFGSTSLKATAQYSTNNGSTWSNWTNDSQVVLDCHGTTNSTAVMSGNFKSGGTTTFDLTKMLLGC